ncbi:hypothetical protein [Diaminobutyricimonas sp. TR449]|uniref:hypothetical protein n=1 Tax=Diaminobutyricimonas sp. TR449 TaxID=2708076 RepID=UPI001422D3B8|nr:hypothetical protein [Diaminobutyricimonas sp. TR449]
MTIGSVWTASGQADSVTLFGLPPILGFSAALVVCLLFVLTGLGVVTGRLRNWVSRAQPGIGSGLMLVGACLSFICVLGIVGFVWTPENTPESAHWILRTVLVALLSLAGITGAAGLSVGWWAWPRFLLPRWQRDELEADEAARRAERSQ